MHGRRLEDRGAGVSAAAVFAAVAGNASALLDFADRSETVHRPEARIRDLRGAPLLLVDTGAGDLICVVPAELWRLARGADTNIAETAAALTESIWHRNCLAVQKQRFIDQFLTFIEHTNRAASVSDVFDALLEHVPALLGVYAALLLVPAAGPHAAQLLAISDSRLPLRAEPLHIPAVRPFGTPAPITDAEIAPGGAFAALAPLLHEVGARCMNSVPIGEHCLLLLVERRAGREFSGEDWFRMHVIARHADRALERFSYVSRNLDVRDDPC